MSTEALYAQISGVTYSAAEDRRLIAAMACPGVVNGLAVTGTGGTRNISISAGTGIVDDGSGGSYLAYTIAATPRTVAAGATETIYLVVDPATSLVTVTSGSTPPSNPHLAIGSAKALTTALDPAYGTAGISVTNREQAYPPAMKGINGRSLYLPLTGGTVAGTVQATRLWVPSYLDASDTLGCVNAPGGVRLGGGNPTKRHYVNVTADPALGGNTNIASSGSAWHAVQWRDSDGTTDYGGAVTPAAGQFRAPVPATYVIGGYVSLTHVNTTGNRSVRIGIYHNDNSSYYNQYCTERTPNASGNEVLSFSTVVNMGTDDYCRVEVQQASGVNTVDVESGRCIFRLVQAN